MKHSFDFRCPSCHQPLQKNERSYTCKQGHNFDISKEGYVNLLLSSSHHTKEHGDNREMIRARRDFLNKGYYESLQKKLQQTVVHLCRELSQPVIVDAGCGEGYYTSALYQALCQVKDSFAIFGFDMSKEALRIASKRCKEIKFAVANLFSMPLADQQADIVLELFAPIAGKEFHRVLKPGGILVLVVPGPQHLFQLKQVIYDTPYYNEEEKIHLPGFTFLKKETIRNTIELSSTQDIHQLFQMTPYYYHTPVAFQRRLDNLEHLQTTTEFHLLFLKRQ